MPLATGVSHSLCASLASGNRDIRVRQTHISTTEMLLPWVHIAPSSASSPLATVFLPFLFPSIKYETKRRKRHKYLIDFDSTVTKPV